MSEWQSIETAPKDGTWVLLCESGTFYMPPHVAYWDDNFDGWWDGEYRWTKFTHWMLLPAPPSADAKSSAIADVVQLEPDQDCPGLWIGFQTDQDRDAAMNLFRVVDSQSPPAEWNEEEIYCQECHGPCRRRPRHGEFNI